jgi:hypothetical protein
MKLIPAISVHRPLARALGPVVASRLADGAHGRRGKRPKSGWRFSLNASRPSWASSLM